MFHVKHKSALLTFVSRETLVRYGTIFRVPRGRESAAEGGRARAGSRRRIPVRTGTPADCGGELPRRFKRSSTVSFVFRWLALSEPCQAPREFPFEPASAERCQLAPFFDLGGGPAAAQAPPRLRVGTADVDARGLRAFRPAFHGRTSIGDPPFALTMEPASRQGRSGRQSRSRCRVRDAVRPPTRRARSRRPCRAA